MTDKDLIDMLSTKRICVGFKPDDFGDVDIVYGPDPVTAEAADRIEALTAERDEAINQLDSAIHSQIVLEKRTAAVMEDRKFILEERDRTFALMLARAEAAEAERDRLRAALDGLLTSVEHADFADGWCCCGDDMLHHQSPMDCGHTPVDMGEYHASLAIKKARAALKGESNDHCA